MTNFFEYDAGDEFIIKRGKYGYRCVMTCAVCPEQYDVFIDEHVVGYLRLRHGFFQARFPDFSGECVYETSKIFGDGTFYNKEERMRELKRAIKYINREVKKKERYVPDPTVSPTTEVG
jgi:hypothetical protein